MKKICFAALILLAARCSLLHASTVPLFLTGAAGSSYAVTALATVTATNTAILYTNYTVTVTNRTDGDGEVFSVSWRGHQKNYVITSNTPTGDQIASASTTNASAFNIMAKLQDDYPFVRVGEFSGATFTLSSPTNEILLVTNSPGYFTVTPSSYHDTTNATQTVTLRAQPAVLVTNQIIYVSGLTTNGSGAVTALTFATNTIVIIQ